jgi:hypothetical protein
MRQSGIFNSSHNLNIEVSWNSFDPAMSGDTGAFDRGKVRFDYGLRLPIIVRSINDCRKSPHK